MATPVTLVGATGVEVASGSPLATSAAPYPSGSAAVASSSGNVSNAVAVATLPAVAAKTNYLSGFEVTGAGATAALVVTVTVAGVVGGPLSYTYSFPAGAAVSTRPIVVAFDPPLPASGVNTAITVTCPAGGAGNTNNAVTAHGYVL